MTNFSSYPFFQKQCSLIKNDKIRQIAVEGINALPEYFFKVASSSTGKYHPTYALGDGGLFRHVIAAVEIADELFRIYDFTDDEKDIIRVALMLHDGWKQGITGTGNTTHSHPLAAVKVLRENVDVDGDLIKKEYLDLICENIASHMGQWTTNKYEPGVVLPAPQTETQKFVHLCDYIASRKALEYNFSAR